MPEKSEQQVAQPEMAEKKEGQSLQDLQDSAQKLAAQALSRVEKSDSGVKLPRNRADDSEHEARETALKTLQLPSEVQEVLKESEKMNPEAVKKIAEACLSMADTLGNFVEATSEQVEGNKQEIGDLAKEIAENPEAAFDLLFDSGPSLNS